MVLPPFIIGGKEGGNAQCCMQAKEVKGEGGKGFEGAAGSTTLSQEREKSEKCSPALPAGTLKGEERKGERGGASFFPPPFKQSEMKLGGDAVKLLARGGSKPNNPLAPSF